MRANDNFFVTLPSTSTDTRGFYKKGLLDLIDKKYPWLTVAGLDAPFYTDKGNPISGVQYAGAGNVLTFGSAKYHDVNWIKRADFAREKGYEPVLDLVKDWNTITRKLDVFAQNRKPAPRYTYSSNRYGREEICVAGNRVTITDNFVFVNNVAIPRELDARRYASLSRRDQEIVTGFIVTFEKL